MGWVELCGCEDTTPPAPSSGAKSVAGISRPSYRGVDYLALGQSLGYAKIKTSDFSYQQDTPALELEIPFYSVAYPYWQFPYHVGPYNQNVIKVFGAGTYHNQSNLGIVGRPRGIDDYNLVAMTPYGVPPEEL